jgi:hypothetical protein
MSEVVALYTPARAGNAKQFQQIAKASTGVSVKTGQASKPVNAKSHNTTEEQIGQYMLLPSLLETYYQDDPDGSYALEVADCNWQEDTNQFYRAYISLGFTKTFWKHAGIRIFFCDGTFNRNIAFKQTILLATTFDCNNQLIILAFTIVDNEDASNWV